jgi:hypothetical protein
VGGEPPRAESEAGALMDALRAHAVTIAAR